jgi:hypothetical protein
MNTVMKFNHKNLKMKIISLTLLILIFNNSLFTQSSVITVDPKTKHQIIDGFGAHQSDAAINQSWFLDLFFNDIECSIYRVDLTPRLRSPYSDLSYFSLGSWVQVSKVFLILKIQPIQMVLKIIESGLTQAQVII